MTREELILKTLSDARQWDLTVLAISVSWLVIGLILGYGACLMIWKPW